MGWEVILLTLLIFLLIIWEKWRGGRGGGGGDSYWTSRWQTVIFYIRDTLYTAAQQYRVTESCRFYSPLTDTEYYRLPAAFVILSFRHKEDYVYSGPLQKKKPEAELESNDGCSIITYRTNCLNSSVTIFSPVLWLEAKKADINNNVFQQCYLRLSLFPYHSTAGLLSVFTTDPKKRTWVWFCLSCFSFLTVGTIGFVSRTL